MTTLPLMTVRLRAEHDAQGLGVGFVDPETVFTGPPPSGCLTRDQALAHPDRALFFRTGMPSATTICGAWRHHRRPPTPPAETPVTTTRGQVAAPTTLKETVCRTNTQHGRAPPAPDYRRRVRRLSARLRLV